MPNRINRKHTFEAKCQSCGKKAITAYKRINSSTIIIVLNEETFKQ